MAEHLSGVLALIVAVGVASQWLAWRLHVPAIVLLMLGGILTGPVAGWIQPSRDLGDLLGPFIKLSVAFILFEGGLSLRLYELREAARGVRRLVSVGVVLSFLLGSGAAHYIGSLSWPVAMVFGAITVVTGPTVIMPLLRHARLRRRPASYLKWEGIINDPIGALLAVVVFDLYVHAGAHPLLLGMLPQVGGGLLAALALGLGVGMLLGTVFRRGWVPEYLKGPMALACALIVYVLANGLQDEAGLVASTVLGIVLGNMRLPSIDELRRFKEYVAVLTVSGVFVLLTADLEPAILLALDWNGVALLLVVIFLVRPASIVLATVGSGMSWQERALLAWIAPRGIVAAAVAGVFAPGLEAQGFGGASLLLPLVFALILATVTLHGFSIAWLAHRLGLSAASPHGLIIVGASRWSVALAKALHEAGARVVLADRSWHRLRAARLDGVPVYYGELLSELSEQRLELSEFAYVFAATENDAYNSLVCTHFASELGRSNVFQLPLQDQDEEDARGLPRTRRGIIALPRGVLFEVLLERCYGGWTFQRTRLTESFDYGDFSHKTPQQSIVFLVVRKQGAVQFNSPERPLRPGPDDQVIWLGPKPERGEGGRKGAEQPLQESSPQTDPRASVVRGRAMHSIRLLLLALVAVTTSLTGVALAKETVSTSHGLAMYGDLKYGADFKHFDYADPQAPKGGEVKLSGIGTFDSLNPFILKGVTPTGIGGLFATLTVQSGDEPFSEYGYVAERIAVPADRSWVSFTLRQQARFQDGSPITPADVMFSFDILKSKGHPFFRAYFASVRSAEQVGPRQVKFTFAQGQNRELPLIIGQLPVLSKAYWQGRDFDKTTLEAPLGSGPYAVESVDPGRSITYRRVAGYWADKLPVMVGRHNFERIRYDYYRDTTVALEAFKAGEYDFRLETVAKDWATAYDISAVREGLIKREEIRHEQPTGMQAFVYNTRRGVFQDRRVREALAYAFDFEWTNKTLFNGAYTRTTSYFSNSELASHGLPDAGELRVLEPFKDRIPPDVLRREYQPPHTDGSGQIRDNLRQAMRLLREAGWEVRAQRLVNKKTAKPMEFEILLDNPAFERIALPFVRNLERLGITARVRTVDTTQYQNRLDDFDFDMVVQSFGQSLSPGNEQRDFWGSKQADTPGSRNIAGVKDPVVDALVEEVIAAPDRQSLVDRTRALDRVLLWGFYVIPQWHLQSFRVAYWDKFGRPKVTPKYNLGFDTWWIDPEKAARLDRLRGRNTP